MHNLLVTFIISWNVSSVVTFERLGASVKFLTVDMKLRTSGTGCLLMVLKAVITTSIFHTDALPVGQRNKLKDQKWNRYNSRGNSIDFGAINW